ncbi:MAG: hypothetical protein ACJAXJ_003536 [Colwellia sp.]|jgi:hypothetical protein
MEQIMVEVKTFLDEVDLFINKIECKNVVVDLTTGWKFPEGIESKHPFLSTKTVSINTGAVTLADVVERELGNVKCGQEVTVILADNRQMVTKMEFFKCNVPADSALTAVEIVNNSNVSFFEGSNYYDENVL